MAERMKAAAFDNLAAMAHYRSEEAVAQLEDEARRARANEKALWRLAWDMRAVLLHEMGGRGRVRSAYYREVLKRADSLIAANGGAP